jgi:clan AA aspartic protease (TIGR02281 family)
MDPESYFGYYRRGWVKDHTGDTEGAIEDYTTSIELEPRYSYAYINRGVLYKLIGEEKQAKKDFEEVIAKDSLREESHTIYALYHLGKVQEAKDLIQKLLSKDESASNCYEAACLYSIAGETETSLEYLRKALEKGNREFNHIKRDRDLKNLRATSEFSVLIEEFEEKWRKDISSDQIEASVEGEEKTVEIPFTKDGGVCKVKCQINGLPLHFIFDTGASDVSISSVEATFMLKNDYLKPSDITGKQNYMNANGDITEGTVINLRKVNFGGLELSNIKASVVKNQSAPLLLGQSVLSRLGRIEIDNTGKVIKITYKGKE